MSAPHDPARRIVTVPALTGAGRELLALREWRLCLDDDDRPILTSLAGHQRWDGPVLRSPWDPLRPDDREVGVFGLKHAFRRTFWNLGWFHGPETWIWGWVAMSGLVEEQAAGFRAERAAIRRLRLGARTLALCPSLDEAFGFAAELEERYQCRVRVSRRAWERSRTATVSRKH